jgi:serine/threonine protein phosphatase PrpC
MCDLTIGQNITAISLIGPCLERAGFREHVSPERLTYVMSEESPKPASLWARIMGLVEQDVPLPVPPLPTPKAPPPPPADAGNDDESVSFADEAMDSNPTLRLKALPPIPDFARNPLEEEPQHFESQADELSPPADSEPPVEPPAAPPVAPPSLPPCTSCGTPRKPDAPYCEDCGYLFPVAGETPPVEIAAEPESTTPNGTKSTRIKNRYLLGQLIAEKLGVKRYQGLDVTTESSVPVVIVQAAVEDDPPLAEAVASDAEEDLMPTFDTEAALPATSDETVPIAEFQSLLAWPRPYWEKALIARLGHPAMPAIIDYFVANDTEQLVLEAPEGRPLWDAWDDPDNGADVRYGWLKQIAELLDVLHKNNAMFEYVRPDQFVVTADQIVRVTDIGDLLPLPIPRGAPLRGTLYTPPELIATPDEVDGRASLYSVGAMLYALEYLHHGLEETDFVSQYVPKQITDRFPDAHPLFPRLLNKTFVKDPAARFPTDEAKRTDPTGFAELIQTLALCQRVFDNVRLDIAAWTTTGMHRTGNEDAFALLHGVDSRQDELSEYALILLCDGMGGYEAGEVAAALAIAEMKKFFLDQPMFAGLSAQSLSGQSLAGKGSPSDSLDVEFDIGAAKKLFEAGLRHANKEVFTAARTPGRGKRGMGCTAEAVYVDSRHIVVGHVGDSRVYHLKDGRLQQLTRDQTLVNRLVELGQIRPEDAEHHPRKNELQQAVGGQPECYPATYYSRLKRGDWVLVCSDGLSNHISDAELEKMLSREASNSAEEAARRLLNLVNLRGATDNATIVVVRAT